MSRRASDIYRGILRGKVSRPDLKPRTLTPEQILELRYQCAMESKDFEEAQKIRALMETDDKKTEPSVAREQAEQLFRRDHNGQ